MKKQGALIAAAMTIGIGSVIFAHAESNHALTLEERVSTLEARVQALEAALNSRSTPATEAPAERHLLDAVTPKYNTLDSGSTATAPGARPAAPDHALPASPQLETGSTVRWQNMTLWKGQLSKGMSQDDVTSLLGRPDEVVDYGPAGQRWWYGAENGGTIDFDVSGHVETWLEPHLQ